MWINCASENTKILRQSRGWSLRELEKISGISFSIINKIETRTKSPKYIHVHRLAKAFGVPVDKFANCQIIDPIGLIWKNVNENEGESS